ncbi:hypothetical protein BY996DRAFT_6415054 [Phakopsora pachyrhizi]|nr:hypothetical protein BY996DRAFT_6415054 [Phakopsora pachyrhizi]
MTFNINSVDANHSLLISHSGRWTSVPSILYGTVLYPFNPVLVDHRLINPKGKSKSTDNLDLDQQHSSAPDQTEIHLSEHLIPPNPHQVPLEVGDECYVFEQYLPANGAPIDTSTIWYRGYIVNQSHRPSSFPQLPQPNPLHASTSPNHHGFGAPSDHTDQPTSQLPCEPNVFLGIFPASHLHIREGLDDPSHRLSQSSAHVSYHPAPNSKQLSPGANPIRSFSKYGPMESLPEEDESESTFRLSGSFGQSHNQKSFQIGGLGQRRSRIRSMTIEKLPIPLPALKTGDETTSGRDEPLIDEIACALREWYTLLYIHLHRRNYRLFHAVKDHIEALHMGRRQLLAQNLSTEEAVQLRRDLVQRLVYGNLIQGLDVIVRHPDYGALAESEVDIDNVDSRSWMSSIRMYVCQVKLAYFNQALINSPVIGPGNLNLLDPSLNQALSSVSSNHQSKLNEPNQIPLNAHLPNSRSTCTAATRTAHAGDLSTSSFLAIASNGNVFNSSSQSASTRPKFYHVLLEVKSFMANPCAEGELIECYFSLYNKSESRFMTEEYCLILNHLGVPVRNMSDHHHNIHTTPQTPSQPGQILISAKTMFRDLSQHDVQDSIFLVCRLVKNGNMKSPLAGAPPLLAPSSSQNEPAPSSNLSGGRLEADSVSPTQSSAEAQQQASPGPDGANFGNQTSSNLFDGNRETHEMSHWLNRTGMQSARRPYGCAVVEIRHFSVHCSSQMLAPNSITRSSNLGFTTNGVLESAAQQYHMNIFSPVHEASFPTLHEDIIASRVKEFFGSGSLTPYVGSSKHSGSNSSPQSSAPIKNESILIEMRTFYGDTASILKENSSSLGGIPLTRRLGFPDVVFPDDEVTAELKNKTGTVLERVISRGSGEPKVTRYSSMVYRNNSTPTWGELLKLDISSEAIEDCHLFFTFRNRSEKPNRSGAGTAANPQSLVDKPFAFAFLPLFSANKTFIPDGEHSLVLFKFDKSCSTPEVYSRVCASLEEGQVTPEITPALSKTLIPLKDTFVVRSFLCSTRHTQNEVLLKLMKWEELLDNPVELRDTLTKLKFASEVEICKFLRNIFDAIFGVLVSRANADNKEYDDLVFNALVTLLGIVSDRRFTNFKPVVDLYIDQHFSCTTASSHLIRSLQSLLMNPTSAQNAQLLRSTIKVWGHLLRLIIRSRDLQRLKDSHAASGGELVSDAIESKFKHDLTTVLNKINSLMSMDSNAIIGTQTLAVQHYASLLPELAKVFTPLDLLEKSNSFCDSIIATKGKIVIWKLLLQEQIVMSPIFDEPEGRLRLIPKLIGWVKPHLGELVDYSAFKPKGNDAIKDSARVTWLEGIRISTAVIAVALDRLHEALIDPEIRADQSSLAQEHDNIEYLLGLLPKLLDSFRELDSPVNVEAVQRLGTTASVISPNPIVFPATYPFSLLNCLPSKSGALQTNGQTATAAPPASGHNPSTQNLLGEISVVMMSMIMISPHKMVENYFEEMLEVEGKENMAKFLSKLFKVFYSVLKNKAFPPNWLNVNVLAHNISLKVLECVSKLMEREFVPKLPTDKTSQAVSVHSASNQQETEDSEKFNSELWSDFLVLIHGMLSSQHLVIEDFPPQKRKAVWKLAGDLRGKGSNIFKRAWEAIGSDFIPVGPDGGMTKCGGYQVQFVPGFIEPLLELCLSHHDEMRNNAVIVLYSVIVSEYKLNGHFAVIADEIIDKLDSLLGSAPNNPQTDELSKSSFVSQLRKLVFESIPLPVNQAVEGSGYRNEQQFHIDEELKIQVDGFLNSLAQFLNLLLSIRNLPPGDEFIDDRVIGTLKLMSFIRNIGRSGIYVHYVHKLVNFHEACGNFVEAGLALRLHADLHQWDLNAVVEAIPELSLPKQTSFYRKEAKYLAKGKAWESGIQICKELQEQYEHVSFDYERLSEVLAHQSSLYQNIVKKDRFFSEYFRVAFYGQGFPPSVQNRQFVYKGYEWEKYSAFCDRMHNKHPNAQILRLNVVAAEELQLLDGQFLHITKVIAEPDRTSIVFTNQEVPTSVVSYYEHNATNTFSYSRPFNKDGSDQGDPLRMWVEKTFLVCEDVFPTVLKRSEILEIRVLEISPIENAIMTTEEKTRELQSLHQRYLALNKTSETRLNTNPLSMILNSMVDAPALTGIPAYKSAFFTSEYFELHPDGQQFVKLLKQAIDNQASAINESLKLHQALCPPEMKTFHETLHQFFTKNFTEEISRLDLDTTYPTVLIADAPEEHTAISSYLGRNVLGECTSSNGFSPHSESSFGGAQSSRLPSKSIGQVLDSQANPGHSSAPTALSPAIYGKSTTGIGKSPSSNNGIPSHDARAGTYPSPVDYGSQTPSLSSGRDGSGQAGAGDIVFQSGGMTNGLLGQHAGFGTSDSSHLQNQTEVSMAQQFTNQNSHNISSEAMSLGREPSAISSKSSEQPHTEKAVRRFLGGGIGSHRTNNTEDRRSILGLKFGIKKVNKAAV